MDRLSLVLKRRIGKYCAIHQMYIFFTAKVNLFYLFKHGTKNNFCVTPN